jgi:hypothetical protein
MRRPRSLAVVGLVLVPLLVYPLAVLARGGPTFPSGGGGCERAASPGDTAELELVYGRFETSAAATELRDDVVRVGFVGTEVRRDACGEWKVVYDGIDDYATGASVVAEARRVGLDPRLELAPPS